MDKQQSSGTVQFASCHAEEVVPRMMNVKYAQCVPEEVVPRIMNVKYAQRAEAKVAKAA